MPIQEELRVPIPHDEIDEPYEEEPRRRSWAAIASVVLALAVIFVGYQWNQAAGREQAVRSQMNALRADAETLRLKADEAQRQVDGLQKQVAALVAERDTLAERLGALDKGGAGRAAVSRDTGRERIAPPARASTSRRATPVVQKKRR